MCGIIGRLSSNRQKNFADIVSASNLLSHRGPDSADHYVSACKRVVFAHRRLAIVDLSDFGKQPMSSSCGRYVILFNGEIYNYLELKNELSLLGITFVSDSDTEVLLAGYIVWKEGVLPKLNGPFAFAIHDKNNDTVFIARDRTGEKPIFFSDLNEEFVFASEQKPIIKLVKSVRQFRATSLVSYISRGYPMQGDSVLTGVSVLKPGHYLRYHLNTGVKEIVVYWSPSFQGVKAPSNCEDLTYELQTIFSDSVRLQLHCDVPACVLLSGGVDSSLITAFASQHSINVKTFTVKFTGHAEFDESDRARLIANYYGTNHTEIEGADLKPDILETIASRIDSPINDSSLIPTFLVYREVAEICKVALGGDGGDELFGGYKHYSRLLLLNRYIGFTLPLMPRSAANFLKNNFFSNYRFKNWIPALSNNLNNHCPNIREIVNPVIARNMLGMNVNSNSYDVFSRDWDDISSHAGSVLANAICADMKGYFPESILVKSDRVSMLNSVESRSPFLDARIIDFALNKVPDSLKSTPNARKILLKNLGRRVLPNSFDFQRKLGFNLPLRDLIRHGEWKSYFSDVIYSQYFFINRQKCISLFNEHLNGINHADLLFGIVLLIRWSQVNGISSVNFNELD